MPNDPILDPLRRTLRNNLRRYLIGRTLGFCPLTDDTIDVRTAVFVNDPDGDPYRALSQRGWAQVVADRDGETLRQLWEAGYRADPSTIKDAELRERSDLTPPVPQIHPDQLGIPGL